MSEETPDWTRFRREFESLLNGAWDTIHSLEDRLVEIERRVKRLEDETRPQERWHRP